MRNPRVEIIGIGHKVPEGIITNQFFIDNSPWYVYDEHGRKKTDENGNIIEKFFTQKDLVDGKFKNGIRERRIAAENEFVEHLALDALLNAIEDAQHTIPDFSAEKLSGIFVGTVTGHRTFPSTAALLSDRLGIKLEVGYDYNNACASFPLGLEIGSHYVKETGGYYAVVVADILSRVNDYIVKKDQISTLFGDAAGAVIVGPSSPRTKKGLAATVSSLDGTKGKSMYINKTDEGLLSMSQGPLVKKYGVTTMLSIMEELLAKTRWKKEDINHFFFHQANEDMLKLIIEWGKLNPERVGFNIEYFANTSGSTIPVMWSMYKQKGLIKPNDKIIAVGFGSGFVGHGAAYQN